MIRRRLATIAPLALVLTAAACSGGSDDALDDLLGAEGGSVVLEQFDAAAGDEVVTGVGGLFDVLPAPTVTTDAGTAFVEVDGRRLEYGFADALFATCEVTPTFVRIAVQTEDGHDLELVASDATGAWTGSITAGVAGSDVRYGSSMEGGQLGIGEQSVSFEGSFDKVVDFDVVEAEEVDGVLAVNCEPASS